MAQESLHSPAGPPPGAPPLPPGPPRPQHRQAPAGADLERPPRRSLPSSQALRGCAPCSAHHALPCFPLVLGKPLELCLHSAQTKVGVLALAFPGPYCVWLPMCMQHPVAVSKDTEGQEHFPGGGAFARLRSLGRREVGRGRSSAVVLPGGPVDLSSWAQKVGVWGPRGLGWDVSVGAQRSSQREKGGQDGAGRVPMACSGACAPPALGGCCRALRWSPACSEDASSRGR